MPSLTPNFSFNLPLVNNPTDADLWGGYLNSNTSSIDTLLLGLLPTGVILPYSAAAAPTGFLLCYGQAVSRVTYVTLFGIVSTTYGVGDGVTTFNVPDLRSRIGVGKDDMGGAASSRITLAGAGFDPTILANTGGSQSLQGHTHSVTDPGHTHPQDAGTAKNQFGANPAWQSGAINITQGGTTQSATTGISIGSTGNGNSGNIQPTIILTYIIKT